MKNLKLSNRCTINCCWFIGSILLFMISFSLCACLLDNIKPTLDNTQQTIQDAINKLSIESSNWQQTLRDLETKLIQDGRDTIANEVSQLMTRGIAQTGTELRCNTDFVGMRMKEDLERVLAKLQGKEPKPREPAFCQVNPEVVNMAYRPTHLSFYGYNLDAPGGIRVSLLDNAGETDVTRWASLPTHYMLTLDTSTGSGIPLCNRENRRIALKWNDKILSEVRVIKMECPSPPPPKMEQVFYETTIHYEGGLIGEAVNREFGGTCSSGYHRSRNLVTAQNKTRADCYFSHWVGDEHMCKINVRFWRDYNGEVYCKIIIHEIGDTMPAPPCPCW